MIKKWILGAGVPQRLIDAERVVISF